LPMSIWVWNSGSKAASPSDPEYSSKLAVVLCGIAPTTHNAPEGGGGETGRKMGAGAPAQCFQDLWSTARCASRPQSGDPGFRYRSCVMHPQPCSDASSARCLGERGPAVSTLLAGPPTRSRPLLCCSTTPPPRLDLPSSPRQRGMVCVNGCLDHTVSVARRGKVGVGGGGVESTCILDGARQQRGNEWPPGQSHGWASRRRTQY
jgi:hypothetical protein